MFQIPWSEQTLPHFVLEVNQVCNIRCKTCYKRFTGETKSLAQIEDELDLIASRRRIQTVSIMGGEPTLHPELPAVVRAVCARNLKATLVTNGLVVDLPMLEALKAAGLDMVMFHIDTLQKRGDLPEGAGQEQVEALRTEKVQLAAAAGLDAGLSFVVGRENFGELLPLVRYVLERPEVSFLLVTHSLAVDRFVAAARAGETFDVNGRTSNDEVYALLSAELGLEPFGYLPSAKIDGQPRRKLQWINYFVPVIYRDGGHRIFQTVSGRPDEVVLRLYRAVAGRYVFYTRQDRTLMAAQLLLNGILSLRARETLAFLAELRRPGSVLRGKRFAFDNGHFLTPAGEVACMEHCPNPTVRDGRIVPVCLADHL